MLSPIFSLFIVLWFVRETKTILFWIYLWQLKAYHIGRFFDHFRTHKGRSLLMNEALIVKLAVLLIPFLMYPEEETSYEFNLYGFFWIIFLSGAAVIYLTEAIKGIADILKRRLKMPVLTPKAVVLIFAGLSAEILFILNSIRGDNIGLALFWLLAFDVFTPIIVSAIVLLLQPFAVLGRNRIINRAKRKRAQFKNLLVIGVTGSYGKTSTKEFIGAVLSKKFNVLKTQAHQNSEVGISQCILNDLKPEHEIFVCEMGAYNKGGIRLLCDIAKPKMGILTGINEQHMATYGSLKNIVKTKFELIESLPEDGTAIFNWDNELIRAEMNGRKDAVRNIKHCSTKEKTDYWAEDIRVGKDNISFKVFSKSGDSTDFKLDLLGAHNALNMLMAAALAKELGMDFKEILQTLPEIKQEKGAMKLLRGKNGANIINSTYSANPDGVISALEYLRVWTGKRVVIMPCLIELGGAAREAHRRIGEKIGEVCDLAIVTTEDYFEEMNRASAGKFLLIENPKEVFKAVKTFLNPDNVILLEGRLPRELIGMFEK